MSALEHWSYCPRQCGLIHLESVWDDNVFTVRGHAAHERADEPMTRHEKGVRVERALPIWSEQYGLAGKADVVEFHGTGGTIVPVEYKSGKPKNKVHARIQMVAQVLCLEEMFDCTINEGALFFVATRQRLAVPITGEVRERSIAVIQEVRAMKVAGKLPPPVNDKRCPNCSLVDACVPGAVVRAALTQGKNLFAPQREVNLP